VAGEPVELLSDAATGDDLVERRRQIDLLEYEFVRRVHRFDRPGGFVASGAASTVAVASVLLPPGQRGGGGGGEVGSTARRASEGKRFARRPHRLRARRRDHAVRERGWHGGCPLGRARPARRSGDDLVLVCGAHHRAVHEGRRQLRRHTDATVEALPS
jgi:hypothetical protein